MLNEHTMHTTQICPYPQFRRTSWQRTFTYSLCNMNLIISVIGYLIAAGRFQKKSIINFRSYCVDCIYSNLYILFLKSQLKKHFLRNLTFFHSFLKRGLRQNSVCFCVALFSLPAHCASQSLPWHSILQPEHLEGTTERMGKFRRQCHPVVEQV